jgi:hypothetical protein
MKTIIAAALAVTVLAAPALSFAQQSQQPLTRAEVREQLVQLEQAGYRPDRSSPYYPQDLQAAEARVAAQQNTAYGASTNGSSQAGSR